MRQGSAVHIYVIPSEARSLTAAYAAYLHGNRGFDVRSFAVFAAQDDNFELRFHPLDLRAELAQFFIQVFVAAIDMINAAHFGNSFRG